ncbi:MAG: glutamate-5-semialdehyde dehydrogenase [Desulfobacteraceae bacterium]|nr:MAG: glutamate-5-semialdehyde dehydrogenase [Desulfobacteraceae bacterium]
MDIQYIAREAQTAAIRMAALGGEIKNKALAEIIHALEAGQPAIIEANQRDLAQAEKEGLAAPLLKRLRFDEARIKEACAGLHTLIRLPDPVGVTLSATELDHGLELYKVSRPIGVIGVIFESRPDALVQISSLCLKSGNAALLKGGSEAAHTNRILADTIVDAAAKAGLPPGWLGLLETRADVAEMLALDRSIDLIIPRGSNAFVRHIMDNTRIPVLGHADGICHVYIERDADLEMAVRIAVDSKCQYVAVCNAAETLLIHADCAERLLPRLQAALENKGVEIRGCEATRKIIDVKPAVEEDWGTEYLDLIISIKVVPDLDAAVDHINAFGSGHTDVIVTADRDLAVHFMDHVDSADVFWNASTRFSDGYRFGLGAEVGISTNKIHARGPVGMEGLLIYQWRLMGNGHIVADYSGDRAKAFTHRKLKKAFEHLTPPSSSFSQ